MTKKNKNSHPMLPKQEHKRPFRAAVRPLSAVDAAALVNMQLGYTPNMWDGEPSARTMQMVSQGSLRMCHNTKR